MDPIQSAKRDDPNKVGTKMAHGMASGLGIPRGTSMWAFPKKPLGKPDGTKGPSPSGNAKPSARPAKAVRGQSRSRPGQARKKSSPFAGGWD